MLLWRAALFSVVTMRPKYTKLESEPIRSPVQPISIEKDQRTDDQETEASAGVEARSLCHRCVGNKYLRVEMQQNGIQRRCSFCEQQGNGYTIEELTERIDRVFQEHYRRTPDCPNSMEQTLLSDKESGYDWERHGEPVIYAIANSADIPEHAALGIQTILADKYDDFESALMGEETEFGAESYYEEKRASDRVWQENWETFERSLKTEARFFSQLAVDHLRSVFSGLEAMATTDGKPMVVDVGPGTRMSVIYRARVFQSEERLTAALCRPDEQLGPPPSSLSIAGRMNAHGISTFYGANKPKVAIAEVRPPVGSQIAVASFKIIRPLRLLDLTSLSAISETGSVFDPQFGARLERAMFLRSLSQRITRPVMPDDEVFEYLPTQAIADYLATESKTGIDGIIFPSAQTAGNSLNVVLFHKAARIEPIDLPDGIEIEATTGHFGEYGWEREYSVFEEFPPEMPDEALPKGQRPEPFNPDSRESTLRIDVESIKVHIVQKVEFATAEYEIQRYWREKNKQ